MSEISYLEPWTTNLTWATCSSSLEHPLLIMERPVWCLPWYSVLGTDLVAQPAVPWQLIKGFSLSCASSHHTQGYLAPKVHATHGLQRWSHGLELVGWGPEVHLDLPITPLGPRANQLHLPLPWVSSLINWENYRFFSKVPSHVPLTVCKYKENSS